MTRCLLITPLTFYAFHQPIRAELEARGYAVDLLNEEFPANRFGKLLGKLALPLLRILTLRGLKARVAGRYDLVVILKGRGLGPKALAFLRGRATQIVGYNFDSFACNPSPRDWHHLTDRYASFDPADAANHSLPLVPLFSAAAARTAPPSHDLSILQRLHSDRLAYLDRVLAALPGVSAQVYLYEPNVLLRLLRWLISPRQMARHAQNIHRRPLPYAAAMAFLARGRVTLDCAHPRQSGITVRCFEAQAMGVAILTNNPAVAASGLFAPGSVAELGLHQDTTDLPQRLALLMQNASPSRTRQATQFVTELLAVSVPQAGGEM